jgi:hypothetical protein
VNFIAVDQGATPPAAGREPFGGHTDDRVEVAACEIVEGPCAPDQRKELVFGVFAARGLRHNLLREDVEPRFALRSGVELAAAKRTE